MSEPITREEALRIAVKALNEYQLAESKEEIEAIFIRYGREAIGYTPLCRMFFSNQPPERAVRIRNSDQ
ncbi:hypothetical protein ACFLUK_02000 [Chloroflexota bacterium]